MQTVSARIDKNPVEAVYWKGQQYNLGEVIITNDTDEVVSVQLSKAGCPCYSIEGMMDMMTIGPGQVHRHTLWLMVANTVTASSVPFNLTISHNNEEILNESIATPVMDKSSEVTVKIERTPAETVYWKAQSYDLGDIVITNNTAEAVTVNLEKTGCPCYSIEGMMEMMTIQPGSSYRHKIWLNVASTVTSNNVPFNLKVIRNNVEIFNESIATPVQDRMSAVLVSIERTAAETVYWKGQSYDLGDIVMINNTTESVTVNLEQTGCPCYSIEGMMAIMTIAPGATHKHKIWLNVPVAAPVTNAPFGLIISHNNIEIFKESILTPVMPMMVAPAAEVPVLDNQ